MLAQTARQARAAAGIFRALGGRRDLCEAAAGNVHPLYWAWSIPVMPEGCRGESP